MNKRCVLAIAALALPVALTAQAYEVYAVRYATLTSFPVRQLVAGADTARREDIAMAVWVLKGPNRTVLVDAGFYREQFVTQWKPVNFTKPSEAVDAMGVAPGSVTDIIVSHVHWDHMDGVDLFPTRRSGFRKPSTSTTSAPTVRRCNAASTQLTPPCSTRCVRLAE